MNKTVASTFIAAALLLVVCFSLNSYGDYVVETHRRLAEELSLYTCYHCYGELDRWQRAADVAGLLALSVSIAGTMFWIREARPIAEQTSILQLDGGAARRAGKMATPLKNALIAEAHVKESRARPQEEESLTPLERVIRGY